MENNKEKYAEYKAEKQELLNKINMLTKRLKDTEALEERHQSDCVKINQLNTALDIMTEKYVNLRRSVGLE